MPIKDRVRDKIVQHIVVAYINDFDEIERSDSLINTLLERGKFEELYHLIWFVWTLRKENNAEMARKVYELWSMLIKVIDFKKKDGRKLASALCLWASYVEEMDSEIEKILLLIAPYSQESHNSYELLRSLARISAKQPLEANTIWQSMLKNAAPDYPTDAIRKILENLVSSGEVGKRAAKETVDEYLRYGSERPLTLLNDLLNG